jgi:hypothetical protein
LSRIVLPDHIQIRERNDELLHSLRLWSPVSRHRYPLSEIKDIAKSVARWSWKHQATMHSPHIKVLKFTDESAEQRMSEGGAYTNALRGDKISGRQLVEHTGMNIETVRKYLPDILKF